MAIEKEDVKVNKKEVTPNKLRPPNHLKVYATNAFVGHSNQDIRIDLCNEKLKSDEGDNWAYLIDTTIILSPVGAKKLFNSLKEQLESYEKAHGKIEYDKPEELIKFS